MIIIIHFTFFYEKSFSKLKMIKLSQKYPIVTIWFLKRIFFFSLNFLLFNWFFFHFLNVNFSFYLTLRAQTICKFLWLTIVCSSSLSCHRKTFFQVLNLIFWRSMFWKKNWRFILIVLICSSLIRNFNYKINTSSKIGKFVFANFFLYLKIYF